MTRLRTWALLAAAAFAAGAPSAAHVPDASAAEPAAILRAALERLTVRYGVAHESLVVLPLVLAEDPDAPVPAPAPAGGADAPRPPDAIRPPASDVTWKPSNNGVLSVVELVGTAGTTPVRRLVPSGSLLLGDGRERMLDGPVPLLDAETASAPSSVCDSREAPAEPADVRRVGRLAPLEQRKMQLLGAYDSLLPTLQRVQAYLAGTPNPVRTVTEVLDAPNVAAGVGARMGVLAKIPGAYAGRTVGHIVYFGYRPVEVVLFARPEDYRSLGPEYLRAAASSHTLWSEAMGAVLRKATDDEVRDLVRFAPRVLKLLGTARTQRVRSVSGERRRWISRVGRTEEVQGWNERSETFVCRFGLDDGGDFAFLEAYENGPSIAYPEPYRGPGQPPVSEPPDNKGNGPMTPAAMERLMQRVRERRERQERERRQNGG